MKELNPIQQMLVATDLLLYEKKLEVKHDETETHYEVVWKDGKPMTKVDEHIWLK